MASKPVFVVSPLPSSAAVAAAFRGLPPEAADAPERGFRYVNCLGREYDAAIMRVGSVTFETSRYGAHLHTINFSLRVSEREAIEAAEAYLSEALTEDYYSRIRRDTFHRMPWAEAQREFTCRGACLTDARFLEVTRLEGGRLRLHTGS